MIAVIQTGSKQYCVQPGDIIKVEQLNASAGTTLQFDNLLGGQALAAKVVDHGVGPKVVSRKFRNKTRYSRVKGHRQPYTVLKIVALDTPKPAAKTKTAKANAEA